MRIMEVYWRAGVSIDLCLVPPKQLPIAISSTEYVLIVCCKMQDVFRFLMVVQREYVHMRLSLDKRTNTNSIVHFDV